MNENKTILDVRPEARFAAGHPAGAANIPLEELAGRAHELPPKGSTLNLFDDDPERRRAAADALRLRGYEAREASLAPEDLRETGPSRARLWQPSPFLVEALDLIRSQAAGQPPPRQACATGCSQPVVIITAPTGPCSSKNTGCKQPVARVPLIALDLACGTGRDAVYMAMCGYEVEAIDVLPDALERARDLARRHGANLTTIEQDLRRSPVLPIGRYYLVVVMRFLHRPLMPAIGRSVVPGGFIIYEAFNWRDSPEGRKPLPPAGALADGELAAAFPDFNPLISRDGIERGGRAFSQLLARRRLGY